MAPKSLSGSQGRMQCLSVPLCPSVSLSVTGFWKPRLEGEEPRVPEGGRLALSSFSVPWHLVDVG